MPGEKIHNGELNLDEVKLLFTPNEYVESLQEILAARQITNIKVIGYDINNKHTYIKDPLEQAKILQQFADARAPDDIKKIFSELESNAQVIRPDTYGKVIRHYINSYANGDDNAYQLAKCFILSSPRGELIGNILGRFDSMFHAATDKLKADPDYLNNVEKFKLFPCDFKRLEKMQVLASLAEAGKLHLPENFWNFNHELSKENIYEISSGVATLFDARNQLRSLAHLYNVLLEEKNSSDSISIRKSIDSRITHVKSLYIQLVMNEMSRYQKTDYGVIEKELLSNSDTKLHKSVEERLNAKIYGFKLSRILNMLEKSEYKLHSLFSRKKSPDSQYSSSAGKVIKLLRDLDLENRNMMISRDEYSPVAKQIQDLLSDKLKKKITLFGLGQRDDATIQLYADVLEILGVQKEVAKNTELKI